MHKFGSKAFSPTLTVIASLSPDIAAVGTIFNVFSYDAVLGRDSNLSPTRQQADALRDMPKTLEDSHCTCISEASTHNNSIVTMFLVVIIYFPHRQNSGVLFGCVIFSYEQKLQ